MVTIPTITAIIALIVMGLQLVAIAYSGFLFFSRQGGLAKEVALIQETILELPTFTQHYKLTADANAKAIADILTVVSVIPGLQQRMLTVEVYMRENGTLKTDISLVSERTGSLVKLLEAVNKQMGLISGRQWESLEREVGLGKKVT